MASGDLTASTPATVTTSYDVKTAVDALNLAATTDKIMVVPIPGRNSSWLVFKVEREA